MVSLVIASTLLSLNLGATPCTPIDNNHTEFGSSLARYVRGGNIDYAQWKKDGEKSLHEYLEKVQALCVKDYKKMSRPEKMAYWINSYNAHTIALILKNYPVKSIKDINKVRGAPWKNRYIPTKLEGRTVLSLDDIENSILRTNFNDPRLHFALVCAAIGCPPIRPEAYHPLRLEKELTTQAKSFINDEKNNRYDRKENTLYLSSIFEWYRGDFGAATNLKKVARYVARYADHAEFWEARSPAIKFLNYDWRLNQR